MGTTPESLCHEAEKRISSHGFLSFFTGGPNYDAAADLFVQAANKYKLDKQWEKAAETFARAAHACEKAGDTTRQASLLVDAGHCAKKYSSQGAAKWYTAAGDIYNHAGRFGQSAKMMKSIADLFEEEADQYQAMTYYKKASEFFDMDEYGKSQYTACILKYAELTSQLQNNLSEAIKIFETEGEKALRNSLMQFGAKDHFFKAGILRLAQGDMVDVKIAIKKYEELDPRFASSREGKLFRNLVAALDEGNQDQFVAAIQDYDNVTRLDPWRVHFLYKVKETLGHSAGGSAVHQLADKFENATSQTDDDDGEVDLS